ncbi:MAG: ATP-binding protein [Burkholderiaceae bacterium]
MKRASWVCFDRRARAVIAALWLLCCGCYCCTATAADEAPLVFGPALLQAGSIHEPPPNASDGWKPVRLPHTWPASELPRGADAVWLHVAFDLPAGPDDVGPWAVYLPYLAAGGRLLLNGSPVAEVPGTRPGLSVNWHRPFLVTLPASLLHKERGNNTNRLLIGTGIVAANKSFRLAGVSIGRYVDLLPKYERRLFWVRTMPQITIVVCELAAAFVLFIWWRRRSEVLYGLFGLAAAFWGIRTSTFVVEALPPAQWHFWNIVVLSATAGFIVVTAIFTFRLAGMRRPKVERCLFAYWLIGTVWVVAAGREGQPLVNLLWTGGLIPIGISIFVTSAFIVWRDRTLAAAVLPATLGLAVLAGVHDYMIEWFPGTIDRLLPDWPGQRIYLLHHAANLLLLAMAGLLTARFIQAVGGLEDLNRTLEARVADRERTLAANYEQLAALQREKAVAEERQLIMRDLHDGLGSQLFTSLSRVERGDMDERQIASALRDCIADMRLALDALASQSSDVGAALANFMFRWESQLIAAGIHPHWDIDAGLEAADLAPHDALQVLRIAQEALTNVLKHARATEVKVRLERHDDKIELEIEDNGCGLTDQPERHGSRGIANMQNRARRLGGRLDVRSSSCGTCIVLKVPIAARAVAMALQRLASLPIGAPPQSF